MQVSASYFLFLFLISNIYANEYRSNEHFLFLFTKNQGNVHENYAFCSKLGMNLISINTVKDESTARSQENKDIEWVWIESTFRNTTGKCNSKCCAMQMKATKVKKEVEFRSENCSEVSAYLACQQNLLSINDDTTVYKNIEESIRRSDYSINLRINETNHQLESSVQDVNKLIGQNKDHLTRSDSNLDKLHDYVGTSERVIKRRLDDREKEITDLKQYVNEGKEVSEKERARIEDALVENSKMMLEQIDKVDDRLRDRAKITDMNYVQSQLAKKINDQDKRQSSRVELYQGQIASYNQKLESTEAELTTVKDEVYVVKQALIYSMVAIGVLILVVPAIAIFIAKSRAKRASNVSTTNSNGRVNDAYL